MRVQQLDDGPVELGHVPRVRLGHLRQEGCQIRERLEILPGLQHEQPVQRVVVLELHQDVVAVPLGVALGLALQAQEVVTGHCTRVPYPRKLRAASRARTESDGKRDEKRRRFRGSPVDAGGRARRADRRRERALDAVCPPRARDAWDRSRRGFDGDLACAPRCAGDAPPRGSWRRRPWFRHRRPACGRVREFFTTVKSTYL